MAQVLFVIGFPRSGTKLLLQLLRTHPEISEAGVEVNLAHQLTGDTTDEQFKEMLKASTLWANVDESTRERLNQFLENNTIESSGSIEAFYTEFVRVCDDGKAQSNYVVDKSPRYITRSKHLLQTMPNARFIHIVRNVKSVAISHNKVWGKNIYRVADQWNKSVTSFYKNCGSDSRVMELRYEDLVAQPNVVMKSISQFLNVEDVFDVENVSSREVHGKAVVRGVVKNSDAETFSQKQQGKIEAIAFEGMTEYAYSIKFAKSARILPLRARLLYFAKDHANLWKFHAKEKGLLKGTHYYIRLIR